MLRNSSRIFRSVRHFSTPVKPAAPAAPTAGAAATKPAEEAPRIYGGLRDQDRIFSNLYGENVSLLFFVFLAHYGCCVCVWLLCLYYHILLRRVDGLGTPDE